MPQKLAAKKHLRKSSKQQDRNLIVKNKMKSVVKKFKKTLEEKNPPNCKKALLEVYQIMDKAAKTNLIHPNKAARRKSRLALMLNKATAKT